MDKISTPAIVRYPSRARFVEINFASDDAVDAYWGVWINTGGWSAHHHFAIEPTTGRFDQLDRAVKDDSAGIVAASAQVNWSVTWALRS
jgi:hypothetical protein